MYDKSIQFIIKGMRLEIKGTVDEFLKTHMNGNYSHTCGLSKFDFSDTRL
jgi:hypothetical protein